MDELNSLRDLLQKNGLTPGQTFGIIGAGIFGCRLRDAAESTGAAVCLCDPPKSRDESDELNDALHVEWGNGMGGCDFSSLRTETLLPMEFLAKFSDLIAIAVPLTEDGPDATAGMISADFLKQCRPHCRILCFSDPNVVSAAIRNDARISFPSL